MADTNQKPKYDYRKTLNLPDTPFSGADGPYRMRMISVPDPGYPGQDLLVFQPVGLGGRRPVIFFAHGFGPNYWQTYIDLISHLVSLGYVLVWAPYPVVELKLSTTQPSPVESSPGALVVRRVQRLCSAAWVLLPDPTPLTMGITLRPGNGP